MSGQQIHGGAKDFVGVEATPGVTPALMHSPVGNSLRPPVAANVLQIQTEKA